MELKQEFLAVLLEGADHEALLELVYRYQVRGLAPQQAYEVLQQIWLELGFNEREEASTLQDNLEYVMEKIWFGCPAPG